MIFEEPFEGRNIAEGTFAKLLDPNKKQLRVELQEKLKNLERKNRS